MKRASLINRCRAELERGASRHVGLQLVCTLLHTDVSHYDWVGFYIAVPDEKLLVLGPYEGAPTDHVRIPYGRGICGQAAERLETFVVADVGAQDNYLACSIHVKSEIVVPVFRDGAFVAEIDIDSHTVDAFTPEDRVFLTELAEMCAPWIPEIPAENEGHSTAEE